MTSVQKHLEKSIRLGYNLPFLTLARVLYAILNEDDLAFKTAWKSTPNAYLVFLFQKELKLRKIIKKELNWWLGVKHDYYKRFANDISISLNKNDNKIETFEKFCSNISIDAKYLNSSS